MTRGGRRAPHAVLLLVIAALFAGPAAGQETLRIGVIGDQTGTSDLDAAYAELERAVAAVNALDVDLVLHTGDLLESAREESVMRADWARARALLDRLDAPWFLTPGDHDVNPPERIADSPDRSREALFRSLLAQADPSAAEGFVRHRDVKGWRIIALYSHEALHADPRWGDIFLARLGEAQLSRLDTLLETAPDPGRTVVFLHQPLWYNWAGWTPVHARLAEHGVPLVIAGHTHYDQIEPALDGVTYLIVGAAGGSTKSGSPHAGALHHVTRIVLDGGAPQITMHPLSDAPAQHFTSRMVMDRVQAVAVMLSGSRFSPDIRPRLEGAACDMLVIEQMGAPIDRPLRVSAAIEGHDLAQPVFRSGACLESAGASCLIPAGYGVSQSNNSSVALHRRHQGAFLSARLVPPPAESVDVRLEAGFELDGQRHVLTETVTLSAQCSPHGASQ